MYIIGITQLIAIIIVGVILSKMIRFQDKKILVLNDLIEKQSSIVTDFEKINKLLTSDHISNLVKLRLEHDQLEMMKIFNEQTEEIKKSSIESMQNLSDNYLKKIENLKESIVEVSPIVSAALVMCLSEVKDENKLEEIIMQRLPNSGIIYTDIVKHAIASMKENEISNYGQMIMVLKKIVSNTL